MGSVNKVMILGRLTRDPELAYTPAKGVALAKFTLALNRKYVTGGQQADEVAFIDVQAWRQSAEACAQFLKKGSQCHVEGRLTQDTWTDKKTGQKRSKLLVTAERVAFVGSKPEETPDEAATGGEEEAA